jgi:hypothetical protein
MKATPLLITWHDSSAPVYSAHFEPNGKGRLATAGGDNNVRVGQDRYILYGTILTGSSYGEWTRTERKGRWNSSRHSQSTANLSM